jgi:hypothetical protein
MLAALAATLLPAPTAAQQVAVEDPVVARIWAEGMERSQAERLAQTLLDSLGPRLTGTPESLAASDWIIDRYRAWGIEARREDYGTWDGWRRGVTHVDLVEPRVRTLEATMLGWSPGTDGAVRGPVVILPPLSSPTDFEAFAGTVEGSFVLLSMPQPTCRPDDNWEEYATEESFQRMQEEREAAARDWAERLRATGLSTSNDVARRLEEAGAAGIFTSRWSEGWGVQKVFSAATERVPTIDVGCEDYGLLARLAENGQGPVVEVRADAEFLGQVPMWNTLGTIPGSELPDEYVILSAHFDSWDGGSGATDNGTGTITMMEAMRILQAAYPNPRRTILVGHWNSEEQGLNGSRAFVTDHPEIVDNVQAVFNQDNGTGRVTNISMQGFTGVARYFAEWFAKVPQEITQHIDLRIPGTPGGGGSDYASFVCAGAPAFGLSSLSWEYGTYTWHTNRDTFDKVVIDDLKNNATLTAALVYLASEEADRLPRDQAVLPVNPRTGQQMTWPTCRDGARSRN